jgi:CBS domain-containing protein
MSEIGLRPKMLVKDVMTSPVITTEEASSANKVAKLMLDNKVGCVVVTNKAGKPLGIVTERDLVVRVLATKTNPSTAKAKDFMTSPLVTVDPETAINDAAKRMSRLDIRRLAVLYKDSLIGIVSSKDILDVMPELLEIMQERTRIEGAGGPEATEGAEEAPLSGYCDRCGVYSENLKDVNGQSLCEDCRIELDGEK